MDAARPMDILRSPAVELARAVDAIVRFEHSAARYLAMAFHSRAGAPYELAVTRYRISSAERLAAQRGLRGAVRSYASELRRQGIGCNDAVAAIRRTVAGVARGDSTSEARVRLSTADRRRLTHSVVRWTVEAYDSAA